MKTKEEIRIEFYGEHDARAYDHDELYIMEHYAKEYHEQQVNLLNKPAVSKCDGIECEAMLPFGFIVWYSGMEKEKIEMAYQRYLREVKRQ